MFKSYEDVVAFGNANVEALVSANKAAYAAVQEFSKVSVDLTKDNLTRSVAAAKEIAGIKKADELVKAQIAFATASFDKAVADSEALTKLATKVSNEVSAPLVARVNAVLPKAA